MYSQGYGQTPYNQKIMLAPGSEVVFDNQAYVGPGRCMEKSPINILKFTTLSF